MTTSDDKKTQDQVDMLANPQLPQWIPNQERSDTSDLLSLAAIASRSSAAAAASKSRAEDVKARQGKLKPAAPPTFQVAMGDEKDSLRRKKLQQPRRSVTSTTRIISKSAASSTQRVRKGLRQIPPSAMLQPSQEGRLPKKGLHNDRLILLRTITGDQEGEPTIDYYPGGVDPEELRQVSEEEEREEEDGHNLAVAIPVQQISVRNMAQAEFFSREDGEADSRRAGRITSDKTVRLVTAVVSVGILLLLVVAVVLGLVLSRQESASENDTKVLYHSSSLAPTATTSVPSEEPSYVLDLPKRSRDALRDPHSAQAKAYRWLTKDPAVHEQTERRLRQRFALATFYYATNGTGWKRRKNWLDYDYHECLWFSTVVSNRILSPCLYNETDGYYEFLWLYDNNLHGTIPPELSMLDTVNYIWLGENSLSGTLPPELFSLSRLDTLQLPGVGLTGTIPTEIGKSVLKFVHLYSNKIRGTIPTEIGAVSSLRQLYLGDNGIQGILPSEFGLLPNLNFVSISRNTGLRGTIPTQLFQATKLREIFLYDTSISGTIPTEAGLLGLRNFSFSNMLLTGTIPSELIGMKTLQNVLIAGNSMTGALPPFHVNATRLEVLILAENQLSGSLPWHNWPSLRELHLQSNDFVGSIPPQYTQLSLLEKLRLDDNLLIGTIPYNLSLALGEYSGNTTEEVELVLNVSQTLLTGKVPENLCYDWFFFDCAPGKLCGCDCDCN